MSALSGINLATSVPVNIPLFSHHSAEKSLTSTSVRLSMKVEVNTMFNPTTNVILKDYKTVV